MATSSSGNVFLAHYSKARSLLPLDHLELFAQCIILFQLDHVCLFTQSIILIAAILLSLLMRPIRTRRRKIRSIKYLADQDIRRQTLRPVKRRGIIRPTDNTSNTQNQNASNSRSQHASTRPLDSTRNNQNQNNSDTGRRNTRVRFLEVTPDISNQITNNTANLTISTRSLENLRNTHNYNTIASQTQAIPPQQVNTDLPPTSNNNNNSNLQSNFGESLPLLGLAPYPTSHKHRVFRMAWRAAFFQTALYARWHVRLIAKKMRLLGCKIHAWTMRQPDKLPILGSELPPNLVSLAIVFMILLNLGFLFVGLPMDHSFFPSLAGRAAILYATNTPALYFLSMKTQPLQYLTHCSYVHLNIFHRRLGDLMFFFVLVHSGIHIGPMVLDAFSDKEHVVWAVIHGTWTQALYHDSGTMTFEQLMIMSGFFALISFSILRHSTTLRRKNYRTFTYVHVAAQFLAQFNLFLHAPFARIYIGVGLGLFMVDRFVFRYFTRNKQLVAHTRMLQDGQIIRLSITERTPRKIMHKFKRFIAKCLTVPWVPGSFVFLKVKTLQAPYNNRSIPFFVMSANERPEGWFVYYDIQMVVRDTGGWSHALLREAIQRTPWFPVEGVELEGPYGTTWPQEMLRDRDICILVGTPDGITLLLALARSLIDWDRDSTFGDDDLTTPPRPKVVIMIYGNQPGGLLWCGEELRMLEARHDMECILFQPSDDMDLVGEEIGWKIRSIDTTMDKRTGVICWGPRDLQRAVRETVSQSRSAGYKCLVDTLSYDH